MGIHHGASSSLCSQGMAAPAVPAVDPRSMARASRHFPAGCRQSWVPMLLVQPMQWSSDAEQRLKEVPFFVRPVVRRRIESLAAEAGLAEVDRSFYEAAKARFGEK